MSETASTSHATAAPETIAATAGGVADLLRAWSSLLESEMALARSSIGWLLIGAILVPVAALSTWLGLDALFVAVARTYTNSLVLALLLAFGVQLLALALLSYQLRRWMRDLTLPHSRAALARAMEKMS
jgi:hypothetical protein